VQSGILGDIAAPLKAHLLTKIKVWHDMLLSHGRSVVRRKQGIDLAQIFICRPSGAGGRQRRR
jgi:hypothetical protein